MPVNSGTATSKLDVPKVLIGILLPLIVKFCVSFRKALTSKTRFLKPFKLAMPCMPGSIGNVLTVTVKSNPA